jgi:hypothetical protein
MPTIIQALFNEQTIFVVFTRFLLSANLVLCPSGLRTICPFPYPHRVLDLRSIRICLVVRRRTWAIVSAMSQEPAPNSIDVHRAGTQTYPPDSIDVSIPRPIRLNPRSIGSAGPVDETSRTPRCLYTDNPGLR